MLNHLGHDGNRSVPALYLRSLLPLCVFCAPIESAVLSVLHSSPNLDGCSDEPCRGLEVCHLVIECVRPLIHISIDELETDLYEVLRSGDSRDGDGSRIGYLRLYRNLRQSGHRSNSATDTIIAEALSVLRGIRDGAQSRPNAAVTAMEDADWLDRHYREGITLDVLCAQDNISMPGLTKRLKKARRRLAEIVYQLEATARVEHRVNQMQRLGAPTHHMLVGADATLQQLKALVQQFGPPFLITVKGIGGIGKSTHVDKLLRDLINEDTWDQVVWISAQQKRLTIGGRLRELAQDELTRASLIERLYEQLFPHQQMPDPFVHESALNRLESHLKECPCCICIDSAEMATDIDALLPTLERLMNPSKVILTTRETVRGYSISPATVELTELSEQDAILLMREAARNNHLTRLQEMQFLDLQRLYSAVGGNPLAIGIIAGQVETLGLHTTLDYLGTVGSIVNEDLFDYLYKRSWENLDATSRSVLSAMALLCPSGGEYALLSKITQIGKGELLKALNQLIALSLVESRGNGANILFRIHNLTRTFLYEQVLEPDQTSGLPAFEEYIERSLSFAAQEMNHTGPVLREEEREQALHILTHALNLAERKATVWPETRTLLLGLGSKFELSGFSADWLPFVEQGIAVSQIRSDLQGEAMLQAHLALLLQRTGDYEAAHSALEVCASKYAILRDEGSLANALTQRAHMYCLQRRHSEARPIMQQVFDLLREDDPRREYVYYLEGLIALNDNDLQTAEEWFSRSLGICQRQGDRRLLAKQLGVMGTALYSKGELEQARKYYEEALALSVAAEDIVQSALMYVGVGVTWLVSNEPHKALEEFAKAEPILAKADEALSLALLDVNSGIAKRQLGAYAEAEQRLLASVDRWRYLGDVHREANAHYELGLLFREQGLSERARQSLHDALDCLNKGEAKLVPLPLRRKVIDFLASLENG